jgi:hypothetical protein
LHVPRASVCVTLWLVIIDNAGQTMANGGTLIELNNPEKLQWNSSKLHSL